MSNIKYNLSETFLKKKYIKEKLSVAKIAKEVGCHSETIRKRMNKLNIPRRDPKKIPIDESKNKYGSLLVVEMVLKLDKEWSDQWYDDNVKDRVDQFYSASQLNGKILSRFGTKFIKENIYLISK